MKKLILILTVLALFCCVFGFASCQRTESVLNIDTLPDTTAYVPTPLNIEIYDDYGNVDMTPFRGYPAASATAPDTTTPDTTTPDTTTPDTTTPDTTTPDTTAPNTDTPVTDTPVVV